MSGSLRLYAAAALFVLVASSFVWLAADDERGTVLTLAGILFWVSGAVLVAIGLVLLSRRG